MKQIVAELDKQLKGMQGALMQIGKAVQAAEEQMQPQMSGEEQKLQAKLMDIKATGELNRQLAAASANQKLEQRQVQWLSTTQQKEAGTQAEIQRTDARTAAELRASLIKAQGDTLINIQKEAKKPAPKATA
jgi:hypothetical protein